MARKDEQDRVAGAFRHHDDGAVIHVVGQGSWSPDEVDRHFAILDETLSALRASGRRIRVLVDLAQAAVQPAETAARVMHWTQRLYAPDDLVAIVVASGLMKVQMRRVAMIARREIFLSLPDAQRWLAEQN